MVKIDIDTRVGKKIYGKNFNRVISSDSKSNKKIKIEYFIEKEMGDLFGGEKFAYKDLNIEEFISKIKELDDGNDVVIRRNYQYCDNDDFDHFYNFSFYGVREETDEEFKNRIGYIEELKEKRKKELEDLLKKEQDAVNSKKKRISALEKEYIKINKG